MLQRCLSAIVAQKDVGDYDVRIIVVENDIEPRNKDAVEAFAALSPFPVIYSQEPRRGISMARNRVLDIAREMNPTWLCFIDDDDVAEPYFLAAHLFVAARDNADVVSPVFIKRYPDPRPFWAVEMSRHQAPSEDGPIHTRLCHSAGTSGTLFSSRLISSAGMGLRFDETLALAGHEDSEFFSRAYELGALIVRSCLPIFFTEVPRSRLTYSRYVSAGLSAGGRSFAWDKKRKGYAAAFAKHSVRALQRFSRGAAQLIVAPFLAPVDMSRFKFTVLEGGRNVCFAAGIIGSMMSIRYYYYSQIDGY